MSAVTDMFTLRGKASAAAPQQPVTTLLPTPKARTKAPAPEVKRVSKSAAAYRTISEVAAELGVATHVLRFWEGKFPTIKPLKKSGGRRYYRPEDIAMLRMIQDLLYTQGYTIKGVQAHLNKARKKELQQAVAQHLTPSQVIAEVKAVRDLLAEGIQAGHSAP